MSTVVTRHPLFILADRERLKDELARSLNPAKVAAAKAAEKPHKLADGGGLYLHVAPAKNRAGKGRRLWRYKYRIQGSENLYAIGDYNEIGLADARRAHLAARWLVERGVHPKDYVLEERERLHAEDAQRKLNTFGAVCEHWLARDAGKLAPVSMAQRRREVNKYLLPALAPRPIADVRKPELTTLLQKIEKHAPEVARNVRFYLAGIFDYAMDAGLVTGSPVPGPRVLKPRNQTPHPALPLTRVGELLRALDESGCNRQTAIALHLLILTAVRKSELLKAEWDEFDLDAGEWRIPAARMKMRREHWVPLSCQAIELLRELRELSSGPRLFPNVHDARRPMSANTINAVLRRLGYLEQAKPHGFRAMFSTYLNEAGRNPDVIETALAHQPRDVIRAKYNRAEYREELRALFQHWADRLGVIDDGARVVPIGAARRA